MSPSSAMHRATRRWGTQMGTQASSRDPRIRPRGLRGTSSPDVERVPVELQHGQTIAFSLAHATSPGKSARHQLHRGVRRAPRHRGGRPRPSLRLEESRGRAKRSENLDQSERWPANRLQTATTVVSTASQGRPLQSPASACASARFGRAARAQRALCAEGPRQSGRARPAGLAEHAFTRGSEELRAGSC